MLLLGEDRLPGEVLADRLVEVLQPRLVGGEEDERVAVEPRRVAARLEDRLGGRLGGVAGLLAVGVVDAEHDQPRVEVVGHVRARFGSGWTRLKSPVLRRSARSALVELLHHLVGVALAVARRGPRPAW